ncbi:hypothetical protein GBAR_LOCUS23271, partial [Geodia barretti]
MVMMNVTSAEFVGFQNNADFYTKHSLCYRCGLHETNQSIA